MKVTVVKLKTVAFIVFAVWSMSILHKARR